MRVEMLFLLTSGIMENNGQLHFEYVAVNVSFSEPADGASHGG